MNGGASVGLKNIRLYRGHGRFASPQAVEVAGERLRAGRIFINVGGRALAPANLRHKRSALFDKFIALKFAKSSRRISDGSGES